VSRVTSKGGRTPTPRAIPSMVEGERGPRWLLTEKRRAAGLCTVCGSPDKTVGRTICDRCNERNKEWYRNNRERARENASARRKADPSREREKQRRLRRQWRDEQLSRYGGMCRCCGESNLRLLTFDHINNDGSKDRIENDVNSSSGLVRLLSRQPVRSDIRILCFNCNYGRAFNGGTCPHVEELQGLVAI
jgi:hypothetical protein